MFRLIILLALSLSLYAQTITLADLAFIVQKNDKVSIVFGNDVDKSVLIDFPSQFSDPNYMPFFRTVLELNNLTIIKKGSVHFVSKIKDPSIPSNGDNLAPPPPLVGSIPPDLNTPPFPSMDQQIVNYDYDFSSYRLKFLQIDNIKPILEFSGVPYSFSTISKTLIFKNTKDTKKIIPKLITELKKLDIKKDQVTLKITIYDTKGEKLREVGLNPQISFDFSLFSQSGALLSGDAVSSFKGSLKLLSDTGATNITQSSSYLISDGEKLEFKKIVSIPFLDENFVLSNQVGTNQSQKFKYKDIGFVVESTPTIVGDIVYLDFSLNIGSVISQGDLPTTSTNSITNKFSAKRGDIILLAGVSKDSIIEKMQSLPFLEDIPFLGDIFTQKSKNKSQDFFNVSIEIQ